MNFSDSPITFILIAINAIFSIIGFSNQDMMSKTIMWPYLVKRNNQYYRFITSGFLHADWMHLFFNMFTLYFFGRNIELIFSAAFPSGKLLYIILYIVSMIVADIPSYLKHRDDSNYRSLGASGAVSGIVFAAIIFDPWSQIQLYGVLKMSALVFAVLYVVFCIYMEKQKADNINHDAHLWGSVVGFVFTLLLIVIFRSDIFPFIIEDLKNPSIMGRRELGLVLRHILM